MTIQEILRETYSRYKLSPLDAEILLSLALNRPKEYILAHPEAELSKPQIRKFENFAKRRSLGESIACIAGRKEFFGLEFAVNENVLIPRPETEMLVEKTIEKVETQNLASLRKEKVIIVDVGTGSGNIIISVIKSLPKKIKNKINFFAVDISKDALKVARINAKKHKVDRRIKFIESDLLKYFLKNKNKISKNVFIVANLPYVSPKIYHENKNNLRCEPKQALLSPDNGLAHYKKLFRQISLLITDRCSLILEISPGQKSGIFRILRKNMPKAKVAFFKDLAGKWRAATVET